jgi:hypothetical protein
MELADEMGVRHPRCLSQYRYGQRLAVTSVHQISGSQQTARLRRVETIVAGLLDVRRAVKRLLTRLWRA